MQDISVLYLSRVCSIPHTGQTAHVHDYWHFALNISGSVRDENGTLLSHAPRCYCFPAGFINPSTICVDTCDSINVMFVVHDQSLYRQLEAFPFSSLRGDALYVPLLISIIEQARDFSPDQNFIDSAFSYYLRLLLTTNQDLKTGPARSINLAGRALSFIEENYMHQIRLEDVAQHIDRSPNYTYYLIKTATGIPVVEHIREVRIKNACRMLAYSNTPLEKIIPACGFISTSYFHRVFRSSVGTTPSRYRTSHQKSHTFYSGDEAALNVPYETPMYTYIPKARKCVFWETPGKYFRQEVE